MKKGFLKEYFSFTKKERNAVLVLIVLISLFFVLPRIMPSPPSVPIATDTVLQKQTARIVEYRDSGHYKKRYAPYPKRQYPYRPYSSDYKTYPKRDYKEYPHYERAYTTSKPAGNVRIIDINNADSSELLPLPGIGNKLAARIITFRNKLGGFYKVEQVAETYGLPDSAFQLIKERLKITPGSVTPMDLNTVDAERLKQHPYIRWNLANAIIQYRKQHGDFKEVNDLLRISIITPEILEKIAPYFSISQEPSD